MKTFRPSKRQLRRIIQKEKARVMAEYRHNLDFGSNHERQRMVENRSDRLTLWLQLKGSSPAIYVNETGDDFYPEDYNTFADFLSDMTATLGAPDSLLLNATVADYDGLGMGDVPLQAAFDFVKAGPAEDDFVDL